MLLSSLRTASRFLLARSLTVKRYPSVQSFECPQKDNFRLSRKFIAQRIIIHPVFILIPGLPGIHFRYHFDANNKSDSEFLKGHLDQIGKQEEKPILVTDGAYSGSGNTEAAAENNIDLITTDLKGKDVDPVMGAFQFNEDGTKVTSCPAGNTPKSCWYNQKTGQVLLSFDRDRCAGCPYQQNCRPKIFKNNYFF